MQSNRYDLAIVGAGIYGLSLADHAAAKGLRVKLLDMGKAAGRTNASSGETRLFRETIVEDPDYGVYAHTSKAYLMDLAKSSSRPLFTKTGFAFIAEPGSQNQKHHSAIDIASRANQIAAQANILHNTLSGKELSERFPALNIDDNSTVFYEPSALTLHIDHIYDAIMHRVMAAGVDISLDNEVARVTERTGFVQLELKSGETVDANYVVLATGEGQLGRESESKVVPQPVKWFEDAGNTEFPAIVMTRPSTPLLFGFPRVDGSIGAKFVLENDVADKVRAEGLMPAIDDSVSEVLPNLGPAVRSTRCSYVTTPNSRILVRKRGERVLAINGCSGHGYKLAPGVTNMIADAIAQENLGSCIME